MSKDKNIKLKDLKLAEMRYYDKKNNGVEVGEAVSYVFLVKVKDIYVNPFNPLERYPIFKRAPYANVTANGDDYGSKLWLVDGDDCSGPCYILFGDELKKEFSEDSLSLTDLENCILSSDKFFKDRREIALRKFKSQPFKMYKLLKRDEIKQDSLIHFFESRNVHMQKVR